MEGFGEFSFDKETTSPCMANARLKIRSHSRECPAMTFPRTTREYVYTETKTNTFTLTNTDETAQLHTTVTIDTRDF